MTVKLLIFEGADKTGKSQLMAEYNKKTRFKDVCVDRAFLSNYVYSLLRQEYDCGNFLNALCKINEVIPVLIIYCFCSLQTLEKRLESSPEEHVIFVKSSLKTYENVLPIFQSRGIKIIQINTDESLEECVNKLIKQVEEA